MASVDHSSSTGFLVRCASCFRRTSRAGVVREELFFYCRDCRPPRPVAVEPPPPLAAEALPESRRVTVVPNATLARRALALLVDGTAIAVVLVFVLSHLSDPTAVLWITLAVPCVYEAVFLMGTGQTIGKSVAGIQVVSTDGAPVGDAQAWGRAAAKVAQLACCGVPLLATLVSPERRGIHDLLAGTRVVAVDADSSVGGE